jgi:hypothetical protein
VRKEINLRFFTLAIAVAAAHFMTAATLLTAASASLRVTPLVIIGDLLLGNVAAVIIVLFVSSTLACIPFAMPKPVRRDLLLFVTPQQALVILHIFAAVWVVASGRYPDGYYPTDRWHFIAVDQVWVLTICFWHTIEFLLTLVGAASAKPR